MSSWPWTWLGGLFSGCTPGGGDLANVTIEEGQRLTTHEASTPIISLATIEKQGRAKLNQQSELNSETEQIQQILTIVENLRRQPSPLAQDHLVAELHRIFYVVNGCPPTAADALPEGDQAVTQEDTGAGVLPPQKPQRLTKRKKEASFLLCIIVVRNVLTWARRHLAAQAARAKDAGLPRREDDDDDGLDGLILAMVAALDQAQQTELHGILQGLPPSVLGDEGAQEETRVFLDVKRDIQEAQKLEGSKVERRQQLVEVVTGVVVELIQTLSPTIVCESKGKEKEEGHHRQGSAARVVASLLACVEQKDRLRLVMEQLLLASSKWLPKDHERRDERLRAVFRLSQYEDAAPPPAEALVLLS